MQYPDLFSHPIVTEPIASTDASAPVDNPIFSDSAVDSAVAWTDGST
jgi:hypothetical protein